MAKPPSQAAANYEAPDFTKYVTKEPTATQEHFYNWVLANTGITFATKKEEAAFKSGIVIGTSLRGHHQASPENQQRLAEQRAAAKAAAEEAARAPKPEKAAAPAKAAPAKAAKASKATAPAVAAVTEEVPPATRPAAKRGGRRATAAAGSANKSDLAPF
jgi:hypothetical protein